jgi:hypothetical protein
MDPICRHREGILKVAGLALIPVAIASGGSAGGPIFGVTSATLTISAEALDNKPCRSERITITAVLPILGGGVGGAFSAGGFVAGEAVTQTGVAGVSAVELKC